MKTYGENKLMFRRTMNLVLIDRYSTIVHHFLTDTRWESHFPISIQMLF